MNINSVPLRGTLPALPVHPPDCGRCASLSLGLSMSMPRRGTEHNKKQLLLQLVNVLMHANAKFELLMNMRPLWPSASF